jgi:hypothetical protein
MAPSLLLGTALLMEAVAVTLVVVVAVAEVVAATGVEVDIRIEGINLIKADTEDLDRNIQEIVSVTLQHRLIPQLLFRDN